MRDARDSQARPLPGDTVPALRSLVAAQALVLALVLLAASLRLRRAASP